MNYRKITFIILTVLILGTIFYNSYFPKFLITGKYVANIEDEFATFGVSNGDQLILNEDGTFQSDSWGTGTYVLKGKEIEFNYNDGSIHTQFNRPLFFGKPRIIIFRDLKSEFIKK
ncbi:hypothetical protein [Psychroserpens luteolus]|uniref:hypothetical protein n=1 Tax=Psychroserpens luteolus TaxID=2855840 RepID=UPI001E56CF91|nr:hypothetical protein [Psychroserpens luteolus]MCD2259499.1 hypothetical protein [Psychroserpens luteolus]